MFGHILWIFPYIGLKHRPYIFIYGIGTSNKSVPVAWPLVGKKSWRSTTSNPIPILNTAILCSNICGFDMF